ncbi:MAG: hypothetical protein IPL61_27740 [Myxococcales bacterium]|nr:hypothetical protein [Myxococcales bacterium]
MATPAPAAAGGDAQALIAKHAAKTQTGAEADAAIVAKVEGQIANSPMGWLQGVLGEAGSKADSEKGAAQEHVDEMKEEVSKNEKDAPADAGAPPKPGTATKPSVQTPASAKGGDKGGPAKKGGGDGGGGKQPGKAGGKPATKGGGPAAAGGGGGDMIAALAGGDGDISAALDAYEPKAPGTKDTIAKIKQMGDVAQGFQGQIDTYIGSAGDGLNGALARAGNWIGEGKNIAAVWSNNPYKKAEGFLGSIMKVLSAIKSIAGVVGSICGKIGLILTVVGLLGMIFPPIGAAVSAVARILNIVGLICDVISFALSGVLTGLNGVRLAQLVAAGASPEEKAACADQMMSEANDAASGVISLAMQFGPKFMKGMLGKSKGIMNGLFKRAKALIGRVTKGISGNVKNFVDKVFRKLGFGGVKGRIVNGVWQAEKGAVAKAGDFIKDKASKAATWAGKTKPAQFVKNTASKVAETVGNSKPVKIVKDATTKAADWAKDKGARLSTAVKTKINQINDGKFMRALDERAAKMNKFADKIDIEQGVENLGKKAGSVGENWDATKSLAKGTQSIEDQTKAYQKKLAEENVANLAEAREKWMREQAAKKQAQNLEMKSQGISNSKGRGAVKLEARQLEKEASQVGALTKTEAKTATDAAEKSTKDATKLADANERIDEEFKAKRDKDPAAFADDAQKARMRRRELEGSLAGDEAQRDSLKKIAEKDLTAAQTAELAALDKKLKPLEELRKQDDRYYKALSGGAERPTGPSGGVIDQAKWYKETGGKVVSGARAASDLYNAGGAAIDAMQGEDVSFNGAPSKWNMPGVGQLVKPDKKNWEDAEAFDFKNPLAWDKDGAKSNADERSSAAAKKLGGAPALSVPDESKSEFHDFVVKKAATTSIAGTVRSMLAGIKKKDPAATPSTPTPTPVAPATQNAPVSAARQNANPDAAPSVTATPTATPTAEPAAATPAAATPAGATPAAATPAGATPAAEPAAATPAEPAADTGGAGGGTPDAGGDGGGGEPLPYWPHLLAPGGEFTMAMKDFSFMRKITIEFKKGQVSAKQKAVDTLATYGKYEEYAAKRKAEAATHKADTQAAGQVTQQNQQAAGDGATQAGQADAKQNEGKSAAGQKAAVDLPEPESKGFWGRIIGRIKRWAKNKAAEIFGWIQGKIADVILRGLCGVSMADMKAYSGALKNQQARAKGVADTGAETSDKAGGEGRRGQDDLAEGDRGGREVDRRGRHQPHRGRHVPAGHQQLRAAAQGRGRDREPVHLADHRRGEAGPRRRQGGRGEGQVRGGGGQGGARGRGPGRRDRRHRRRRPARPERAARAVVERAVVERAVIERAGRRRGRGQRRRAGAADEEADEAHNAALVRDAASYVAGAADTGVAQVESKVEDYKNQIKASTTNRDKKQTAQLEAGNADIGDGATDIVAELKTEISGAKTQLLEIEGGSDAAVSAVTAIAETVDKQLQQANEALDKAFLSVYEKIKSSARTTKSAALEGVNGVAAPVTNAVQGQLDKREGTADAVWNTGADVVGAVANPVGNAATDAAAWTVNKAAWAGAGTIYGMEQYGEAQAQGGVPMMPY